MNNNFISYIRKHLKKIRRIQYRNIISDKRSIYYYIPEIILNC